MATELKCQSCHKMRAGRFTRKKTDTNLDFPRWYCWTCLKAGQGRDETEETVAPAKDVAVLPAGRAQTELTVARVQVEATLSTIQKEVAELKVFDAQSYLYADNLLGRIRANRSVWGKVWARIQEKSIRPIREGLEELYALNRDVDVPQEKMEDIVKARMKFYKQEELKQINAEKLRKQLESQRLLDEAQAKQVAAARAQTPQMRGRLQAQAERATEQAVAVVEREVAEPVTGESSSTRPKKAWRIKNMREFCAAIGDGTLPEDCVTTLNPIMNQYFKHDPEGMQVWPGVEVYDDVQIVGR